MLVRFPQIQKGNRDRSFIIAGMRPIAKHNKINKTGDQQIGFLTEHTLFFILQGKKLFHFGNKTIAIGPDQLILLKRGIYSISEYMQEGGEFEALMIFFPDEFLKRYYLNMVLNEKVTSLTEPYVIIPNGDLLDAFKSQYLNYFGKTIREKERLFDLKLQELLLLLNGSDARNNVWSFICQCADDKPADIEYIAKTYLFQPLTLTELAKLSSRSLASFKRDFEDHFHCSPRKWINGQRLDYANTLLNRTRKTVAEIVYECGFESVSHFIKIYKKRFGTTPGQQRAENTIF